MSRKTARENLFKLVYEKCVVGGDNPLTFNLLTAEMGEDDLSYVENAYAGISQRFDFLSNAIEGYSVAFSLARVFKVDLAILLVASYEILFMDDIPMAVSVNEGVELTKIYSTEKSSAFVNGVLSSVIRDKEKLLDECANN